MVNCQNNNYWNIMKLESTGNSKLKLMIRMEYGNLLTGGSNYQWYSNNDKISNGTNSTYRELVQTIKGE